jgi:hypothetical protein
MPIFTSSQLSAFSKHSKPHCIPDDRRVFFFFNFPLLEHMCWEPLGAFYWSCRADPARVVFYHHWQVLWSTATDVLQL